MHVYLAFIFVNVFSIVELQSGSTNREYNDRLFYLDLVAPLGCSNHGVDVFME